MSVLRSIACVTVLLGAGLDFDFESAPTQPELDFGRTCLALVGFSEARDQSDAGLAMTMQVVVNRATDRFHRWPATLCDVALQPGQFIGLEHWPTPRNPERIDATSWRRALDMADHVIAGDAPLPAECSRATGFDQAPMATTDARFACRLGAHTFYTDTPLTAAK